MNHVKPTAWSIAALLTLTLTILSCTSSNPILTTWKGLDNHSTYFLHFNDAESLIFQWKPNYLIYGRTEHQENSFASKMIYVIEWGSSSYEKAPINQKEQWDYAIKDSVLTATRFIMRGDEKHKVDTMRFQKANPNELGAIMEKVNHANNQIHSDTRSETRISELEAMLSEKPQGIGKPISDREFWDEWKTTEDAIQLIQKADAYLDTPIPELPDELYLEYFNTGNRTHYQDTHAKRHTMLQTLVLAELASNEGSYITKIEAVLNSICNDKTWILPAHDRDKANFEGSRIDIDLRSAAISWEFAVIDAIVGKVLSKPIRTKIKQNVYERIIEPFTKMVHEEREVNWWLLGTNNWNSVCLAGVTGAFLYFVEDKHRRATLLYYVENYIHNFLRGFTSDGYCSEGLGYWNYGFGHYIMLAEVIKRATAGKLDWMDDPYVEKIARFPLRLQMVPGIYPAFADCSVDANPSDIYMTYLNLRYNMNLTQWSQPDRKFDYTLYAIALFAMEPPDFYATPATNNSASEPLPSRSWFEQAGILISRPNEGKAGMSVAMKGGHNAEHHNHNDIGSYVVTWDDEIMLVDPGSEIYTKRTFSEDRYESDVLNSFGHPVPLVAGKMQRASHNAKAEILDTQFSKEQDLLVLDLTAGYDVPELTSLIRKFTFIRSNNQLIIEDTVKYSSPQNFENALITFQAWEPINESTLRIKAEQAGIQVEITSSIPFSIVPKELEADVHYHTQPLRLGIRLDEPVQEATMQFRISYDAEYNPHDTKPEQDEAHEEPGNEDHA